MHPLAQLITRPSYGLAALALIGLSASSLQSAAWDPAESLPRILIVNDDGIDSPGVQALVDAFASIAEVHVCAPDSNRSGASASTSALSGFMSVEPREIKGATSAWAVSGQPVDAAQFGLLELGPTGKPSDFDLVISGINDGANVGNLQQYSGTVGAASAAVHYGVPAIAISQGSRLRSFEFSAQFAVRFVEQLNEHGAQAGIVYSINIPVAKAEQVISIQPAPQGGQYFHVDDFRRRTDAEGKQTARAAMGFKSKQPAGSDTDFFLKKHITITPLRIDRTDAAVLAELKTWRF
jgi:5'/3'-nucleotidase